MWINRLVFLSRADVVVIATILTIAAALLVLAGYVMPAPRNVSQLWILWVAGVCWWSASLALMALGLWLRS